MRHSTISIYRLGELARYQALLQKSVSSTAETGLQAIFSELLKRIEQNLQFDLLDMGLHDSSRNVISVILRAGEHDFPPEIPVHENSLGIVLNNRQAIEVEDVENEARFDDLVSGAKSGGFRSFRIVPLITDRRPLGVLAVVRRQPGPFSPEDVRYLDHAAQWIALLLENALMADALSREKAQLKTLLDVNSTLVSSLDIRKLLPQISSSMRPIVHQHYTHFALYEEAADVMRCFVLDSEGRARVGLSDVLVPVTESPAGIAFVRGQPTFFREQDLQQIGSIYVKQLLDAGVRSTGCFPLTNRGRKIGTLGLSRVNDDPFREDEVVLLTQISAQVAIAIDNARAYQEIARFKDRLAKEKLYLEDEIRSELNFGEVVGNSPVLRNTLQQVEIAAPSDATVLVLGETGTGKELIARAVHRLSSRHEGNFIKLNCAAIPTGLLESELFGHEKGAFTGAISQKIGRLELADKGTLFLDEIGEIPLEVQPKLLRVLQDLEFERLGGIKTIKVNVRLVAATNRDLAQAVEKRLFRSDLYYRINVFPIHVPPLRERTGDMALLVRYFVQKFARRMGKNIDTIPSEVIHELEQWHWPGNIRELENFIERSVILTHGNVLFTPLAELRVTYPEPARGSLQEVEREYILRTLRESGGVIAGVRGAAARLGMKRTTLQSRMQKLGINRQEYET